MKSFSLLTILLALCLLAAPGCRQRDMRQMTVALPGVTSDDDRRVVLMAIDKLVGIERKSIVFDETKKEMRLTYDSMQIRRKNVEIAIAEAGYDANEVPALPRGKK